ncbi:AT-rich interactive domain-containing protein 4A-like isoform X2 [Ptychodera flava]|uniref:AT-rich interactive domain-containing protein 4A-like isoform X2 n=1 Tax=Ptychodera flava TaxID=63121 RepID=UPI003969F0FD
MAAIGMGVEPPYLTVGTDVSAKYRGAFCEAKVKSAKKLVKCKINFKDGSTAVVTDDQVKGPLRIGLQVEAKHPDGVYMEGTITKLTDASSYTVVFDDGDERTLRRTALCLQGEKHFNESETLDHLPLTDPENFGTPVMREGKKSRKRRRASPYSWSDDEDDEIELDSPKKKRHSTQDENIGQVVLIEMIDKRKTLWYPALCVYPHRVPDVEVKGKDHIIVRSFKDGKSHSVSKKDVREFIQKEHTLSKADSGLKPAIEKAIAFQDTGELPSTWDPNLLRRSNDDSDSDDDEDEEDEEETDDEDSDDEYDEEKDRWLAELYKFMEERGTPINKPPVLGYRDLNLYKLYKLVQEMGGCKKLTDNQKWRTVYTKMGIPVLNSAASYNIKAAYNKYLYAFEDHCRKLGSSFAMTRRSSSSRLRQQKPKAVKRLNTSSKDSDDEDTKVKKKTGRKSDAKKDAEKEAELEREEREKQEEQEREREREREKEIERERELEKERQKECEKEKEMKEKEKEKKESKKRKSRDDTSKKVEEKEMEPDEADKSSVNSPGCDNGDKDSETADFSIGEKIQVKYGRGRNQKVYEAKIVDLDKEEGDTTYYVHYSGWNVRYDEWIHKDRIVKSLESPKESPPPKKKSGKTPTKSKQNEKEKEEKVKEEGEVEKSKDKQSDKDKEKNKDKDKEKGKGKRGRPPAGKATPPIVQRNSGARARSPGASSPGPVTKTTGRVTRSDRNSLSDSPFAHGLEAKTRTRRSSGVAEQRPKLDGSDSESDTDEQPCSAAKDKTEKEDLKTANKDNAKDEHAEEIKDEKEIKHEKKEQLQSASTEQIKKEKTPPPAESKTKDEKKDSNSKGRARKERKTANTQAKKEKDASDKKELAKKNTDVKKETVQKETDVKVDSKIEKENETEEKVDNEKTEKEDKTDKEKRKVRKRGRKVDEKKTDVKTDTETEKKEKIQEKIKEEMKQETTVDEKEVQKSDKEDDIGCQDKDRSEQSDLKPQMPPENVYVEKSVPTTCTSTIENIDVKDLPVVQTKIIEETRENTDTTTRSLLNTPPATPESLSQNASQDEPSVNNCKAKQDEAKSDSECSIEVENGTATQAMTLSATPANALDLLSRVSSNIPSNSLNSIHNVATTESNSSTEVEPTSSSRKRHRDSTAEESTTPNKRRRQSSKRAASGRTRRDSVREKPPHSSDSDDTVQVDGAVNSGTVQSRDGSANTSTASTSQSASASTSSSGNGKPNSPGTRSRSPQQPRSPRQSKWNFVIDLAHIHCAEERIAFIQQQLTDLRKIYTSLKAEVASIDRRRKRLRRKEREAAQQNQAAKALAAQQNQNSSTSLECS